MTVLLDTNIAIYAHDHDQQDHEDSRIKVEALKAVDELGYTPVIAAATLDELAHAGASGQSGLEGASRYRRVTPDPPGNLRQRTGYSDVLGANDECDLNILGALDQGLVAWLVTKTTGD